MAQKKSAYNKRNNMSFSPTIEIVTPIKNFIDYGVDVYDAVALEDARKYASSQLSDALRNAALGKNLVFNSDFIRVLETGEIIETYDALVVSRFYRHDLLNLVLADGNTIVVDINVIP